jgi:hypothetical protein
VPAYSFSSDADIGVSLLGWRFVLLLREVYTPAQRLDQRVTSSVTPLHRR